MQKSRLPFEGGLFFFVCDGGRMGAMLVYADADAPFGRKRTGLYWMFYWLLVTAIC